MYYATVPDAYGASDLIMLDGTTISVLQPGVLMGVPVCDVQQLDLCVPDAGRLNILLIPLSLDDVGLYLDDCEVAL